MSETKKRNNFFDICLENGLKALVYPVPNVHSVSVVALIRAGHLCEKVSENGAAHLLEHMLFDGTEEYPDYKKLVDFYDKIAGGLDGGTSFETIGIGGTFVDEELENALHLLDQVIFHPLINQEFLDKEKGIIVDELSSQEDSNAYIHFKNTKNIRFIGETILKLPLGGTRDSVRKLTLEQIKSYYKRFFRTDNTTIVIAGKCNPKKVKGYLEKTFFYPPLKDKVSHKKFSYDQFSGKEILLIPKESEKSYIGITFPSYSWKEDVKKRVALSYLCSLLSNRRDSLLFSKLREELGWIYDIDASFLVGFDVGVLEIITSAPIDKSLEVIKEILSAVDFVKKNPFDTKFFEKVKDIDRKRMKMSLDTTKDIVNWFSEEMFYRYPKIMLPSDFMKIYDTVTTEDVQSVANEIFNMDKINICVLQPFKKLGKLQYKNALHKLIND